MGNTESTLHETSNSRHVWRRRLEGIDDPASQLRVQVHDGRLIIRVKDHVEHITLPEDAYTADIHASFRRGELVVDVAAKDPNSPAMIEKKTLDPDRPHPRDVDIELGGHRKAHEAVPDRLDPTHGPSPIEVEAGERRQELQSEGHKEAAPVEEEPYPAGAEMEVESEELPHHIAVDYTREKVGLATRPAEARDFYTTAETGPEPFSSLQGGDPELECDLCRCTPCQCDKVDHRFPYELTGPEQKRSGKPHLQHKAKPTTGVQHHPAHDFRTHAMPRNEHHAGVGRRLGDYVGNVHMGEAEGAAAASPGAKPIGGREIPPELLHDPTRANEKAQHFLG